MACGTFISCHFHYIIFEFRSNYHLNGTVEKVEISEEFEEQACRAARVLGLNVAGVDLLESNNGPLFVWRISMEGFDKG